jgi:hypothetical protein
MATENSDWGAPKIHGELRELGFEVCERTPSPDICDGRGYVAAIRPNVGCRFSPIIEKRSSDLIFLSLPTLTFQLLYCLFVIEHSRRKVLYFTVTRDPTSDWVVQQLREAFPEAGHYRMSAWITTRNSTPL